MASHLTSSRPKFCCTNRVLQREKSCTKKREVTRTGLQKSRAQDRPGNQISICGA